MATKAQLIEMLERLSDSAPLSQNGDLGGCVWCGSTPKGMPFAAASSDFADHTENCEWVEARKLLGYMSGE